MSDSVIVSIPYWRSPETIGRAVRAVLEQDHTNLKCVVINDGDNEEELRNALADFTYDPRLFLYTLDKNQGRYFADQVTLEVAHSLDPTGWFTVHDADDKASRTWLSTQLREAKRHDASAVFCAHRLHGIHSRTARIEQPQPYRGYYRHHAHMAGLWKTAFLKELGGLRPDFRVGYDSMITGVALATGKVYLHRAVLYERYLQRDSLTKAETTRIGSPLRKRSREWMESHWHAAVTAARTSPHKAGQILTSSIPTPVRAALNRHATELRELMTHPHTATTYPWADCLNDPSLWGAWALNQETGYALARELEERKPSLILEGGSGTSTLLFSQYADQFGARVISLESSRDFQTKTQDLLRHHKTGTNTEVRYTPLRTTPDGPWYDYDTLPDGIDFALVDGPRERDGGRRAAMPALLPHLKPGALVILDDTNRPKEQSDLAEWKRRYGLDYRSVTGSASHITIPTVDASSTGGAKVAITLLTGRRPQLLRRTLARLQTCMPGLLRRAHLTVLHNGGDAETKTALSDYTDLIDVTLTTDTLLGIGEATSMLARAATVSGRKYWLHLEDDWTAIPTGSDWIGRAQQILHTRPSVYQVRLRYHGETTLTRHMTTNRPLRWTSHAGYRLAADAHYTNNPSLVRVADAEKIWPATGEREAQRNAWNNGLRGVAQLMPGAFQHTGGGASLREETKCTL